MQEVELSLIKKRTKTKAKAKSSKCQKVKKFYTEKSKRAHFNANVKMVAIHYNSKWEKVNNLKSHNRRQGKRQRSKTQIDITEQKQIKT